MIFIIDWGRSLNKRVGASDRSLVLRVRVETLMQQFEELEQLRERVRRAEANAIFARRDGRSCLRGKSARTRALRRRCRRVR